MTHPDRRMRLFTLIKFLFGLSLFLSIPALLPGSNAQEDVHLPQRGDTRTGTTASISAAASFAPAAGTVSELETLFLPVAFSSYPDDSYPIFKGTLTVDDVIMTSLAAGRIDQWAMILTAGDIITVSAAPGGMGDIMLAVLDGAGKIIVDWQNNSLPGQVESIKDLGIEESGNYSILIRTANDIDSGYALVLSDADAYELLFRGKLAAGDVRDDALPADTDHFWLFTGHSGEFVTVTVTPQGIGDAYVEFYGPDGALIETIDDNGSGESETIDNYPLQDSGMYGILVGEFDFNIMTYQISLLKS